MDDILEQGYLIIAQDATPPPADSESTTGTGTTTSCDNTGGASSEDGPIDCGVDEIGTEGTDSDAGAYIRDLVTELSWAQPALSGVGAILIATMVLTAVIGGARRGGRGGMGLTGMASGLLGLVLIFNPMLIAGIADIVMKFGLDLANFVFSRV